MRGSQRDFERVPRPSGKTQVFSTRLPHIDAILDTLVTGDAVNVMVGDGTTARKLQTSITSSVRLKAAGIVRTKQQHDGERVVSILAWLEPHKVR